MPNTHNHTWQFSKWTEVPAPILDKTQDDWSKQGTALQFVCECGAVKHVQPYESKYNA